MGGSIGDIFSSALHAISLGTVDIRDKPKAPKMPVATNEDTNADKDVQTKRIKTRQNIFNLAGIKGEELEKGEVKSGSGIFSA